MSKRYTGNFISGTPQVPTLTSNNGVFDIKDVYTATNNNAWQEPDGYYEIPKSVRFRASNSNFFSRSQFADGNRKLWTFSAWVKLAGDNGFYMCAGSGTGIGVDCERMQFNNSGNGWYWQRCVIQTSTQYQQDTNGRWRDPSAWYHIMCIWDSNNAVQSERWRTFVNGVKQGRSYGDGAVSLGQNSLFNSTAAWKIGRTDDQSSGYSDCYLAEVNFIDGQALDPSYFGYTDPVTNIWQPKKYTGAYGAYGFYLPFNEPPATSGTINNWNLGRNFAGGTNYIRYSQDGSQTSYGYVYERASNTVNNTTAPDGTTTANKLTSDGTASNTHRFYCAINGTTPAGSTQTASIYLKYNNCRFVNIENWNGTTYQTQTFDLLNGCAATTATAANAISATGFTSQHVGNGWYRVAVPLYHGSGAAATPSIAIYLCDSTTGNITWSGDSTSSVYWWGAQINLGTTADPYFKTASTSTYNNSDWNPSSFSVTNNTGYDLMVDSPTNVFTNATDIGGVVSGNYCTLNPVNKSTGGGTLSEANLRFTTTGGNHTVLGTIAFPTSGKWYFEATDTVTGGNSAVGILQQNQSLETNVVAANINMKYTNMAGNETFGIAVDMDNLTYTLYKSNVVYSSGSASTGSLVSGVTYIPFCMTSSGAGSSVTFNFGQRPFAYSPPSGYKSLNTTNIQSRGSTAVGNAGITPNKWMDVSLYGGTGGTNNVTNSGFAPDLIWGKRSTTGDHYLIDSVRGGSATLASNTTSTEAYQSFMFNLTNTGFNVNSSDALVNGSGTKYTAWQWKQSPTSGFNIVTYTGTGTNNTAISHNLNATPAFIMVKNRDASYNWDIYHQSLGISATLIYTPASTRNVSAFGTTAPTSSNFYTQDQYTNTINNKYVAYVFAEVPGFSKFGSYIGNGSSSGAFSYTGFKPKFVLVKATGTANGTNNSTVWTIWDTSRNTYNPTLSELYPNSTGTEFQDTNGIDIYSNGFRPTRNSEYHNWSGTTYIYAAFAESPFALNNRAR